MSTAFVDCLKKSYGSVIPTYSRGMGQGKCGENDSANDLLLLCMALHLQLEQKEHGKP